ncbi:hypothetical protein PTTG_02235 [Puccinia triticina 1-1 BBBD Race 1]|uniref:Zn(2)-C6 fungal-type domain-containing protein n=2 Tax=Puccinia triticina (isolate 1-1 / race 1 (BBBD)) TaxID=630390 RepID=A0A180GIV2_PUCT1|nr:hypothetical protein PTTG_02235 [Puccinia triticina 1-1 BBBD Race 1]
MASHSHELPTQASILAMDQADSLPEHHHHHHHHHHHSQSQPQEQPYQQQQQPLHSPQSFSLSSSQPAMSPSGQTTSTLASFTPHPDDHRRRKRNRTMQSCLPCHTNKRKCNRGRPCERCTSLGITGNCVYETEDPSVIKKIDLKDPACEIARLRDRIAELEGVVRILKGRPHPKQQRHPNGSIGAQSSLNSPTLGPSSPTFSRSHSQSLGAWSIQDDGNHPMLDLFQSSSSHRNRDNDSSEPVSPSFGGLNYSHTRPTRSSSFRTDLGSLVEDLKENQRLENIPYLRQSSCPPGMKCYGEDQNVIEDDEDGRKMFLGHAAGGSLLRKLQGLTSPELKPHTLDSDTSPPRNEMITAKVAYMGLFGGKIGKRWAFETPGSVTSSSDMRNVLLDALPSTACAQQLLEAFLQDVDCFYHAWHTPTIIDLYQGFFSSSRSEQERLPFSKLSVILSILTATSDLASHIIDAPPMMVGEAKEDYQKRLKTWRFSFSNKLASCTVHSLKLASYLGHPSIECIQAQLLLVLYMVNNDRCTDAWCFIGGVIKQAQCLGLHIDPSKLNPHMPVLEQELRRRVWWSVQTWDVFLGIAFGWPAGVTLSDSDLPSDRTEDSLMGQALATPPSLPPQGVTELTFHVFNWETCLYARNMMDRIFGQASWGWCKTSEPPKGPKYEHVVELDTTIKTWYNRVPAAMRFEPDPIEEYSATKPSGSFQQTTSQVFQPSSTGVGIDDIRRREPMLAKQALLLSISQNTILLLLHRPFLSLSLENSAGATGHQMSEEQCVRSSQVIIEAQRLLVELFPATRRMWYGWYLTFHAAMTCAWISLLRTPTHPMSGLSRKCITLGIETFELAIKTPESLPENYLRACSQLRAIRNYSNRKLNPPKAITYSTHVFGPTSSISPLAYSLAPRAMSTLARNIDKYPNFVEPSARLNFGNEQDMIVFDDPASSSHSLTSKASSYPKESSSHHSSLSNSDDKASCLDEPSSDPQLHAPVHHPPFRFDSNNQQTFTRFTRSAEVGSQDHNNDFSVGSDPLHRSSDSSTKHRSHLAHPGSMHPLDSYSTIGHLTQPQLPPIHGFSSPASGSGIGFCSGTASSTAPPLYAAQYAMNSLQYQDVNVNMNVPLSMLVMHHVNSAEEHGESHHPNEHYSYDSVGQIREENPANNLLFGSYLGEN